MQVSLKRTYIAAELDFGENQQQSVVVDTTSNTPVHVKVRLEQQAVYKHKSRWAGIMDAASIYTYCTQLLS